MENTARSMSESTVEIPSQFYRKPRTLELRNPAANLLYNSLPFTTLPLLVIATWDSFLQYSVKNWQEPGSYPDALPLAYFVFGFAAFLVFELLLVQILRRVRGYPKHRRILASGEPTIGSIRRSEVKYRVGRDSNTCAYGNLVEYVFNGRTYSGEFIYYRSGSDQTLPVGTKVLLLVDQRNPGEFVEYERESLYIVA